MVAVVHPREEVGTLRCSRVMCLESHSKAVFIFSPAGIAVYFSPSRHSLSLFREREPSPRHYSFHFFLLYCVLQCSPVQEPLLVLVPLDGSCVEEVSHCVVLAITTSQVISKTTSLLLHTYSKPSSSTYHFCKKLSACLL